MALIRVTKVCMKFLKKNGYNYMKITMAGFIFFGKLVHRIEKR